MAKRRKEKTREDYRREFLESIHSSLTGTNGLHATKSENDLTKSITCRTTGDRQTDVLVAQHVGTYNQHVTYTAYKVPKRKQSPWYKSRY